MIGVVEVFINRNFVSVIEWNFITFRPWGRFTPKKWTKITIESSLFGWCSSEWKMIRSSEFSTRYQNITMRNFRIIVWHCVDDNNTKTLSFVSKVTTGGDDGHFPAVKILLKFSLSVKKGEKSKVHRGEKWLTKTLIGSTRPIWKESDDEWIFLRTDRIFTHSHHRSLLLHISQRTPSQVIVCKGNVFISVVRDDFSKFRHFSP